MRTYTSYRNDAGQLTNNTETGNLTLLDTFVNDSIRTICNLNGGKLRFLEATKDIYTVADQEAYQVPNGFRKLMSIVVWSENTTNGIPYTPEMIFDPVIWNRIKQAKLGSGTLPYFTYVEGQKFYINPIPSTDGNLIQLRGRLRTRDLSIADYTTGTITSVPFTTTTTGAIASGAVSATLSGAWGLPTGVYSVTFSNGEARLVTLTNAATTMTWSTALTSAATTAITVNASNGGSIITASGTTFTEDMVGRYIRITETTAANGGDGYWYEIGDYYDATHIALLKPYEGTAISGGTAAYTIGQTAPIPEAYDIAVVYRATAIYYQQQKDLTTAKTYWTLYDGGFEAGYTKEYGGIIGQMLENEGETEEGAYIPPAGSTEPAAMGTPYYFPMQDASGFN